MTAEDVFVVDSVVLPVPASGDPLPAEWRVHRVAPGAGTDGERARRAVLAAAEAIRADESKLVVLTDDPADPAVAAVHGLIRCAQAEHPGRILLVDGDLPARQTVENLTGEWQISIRDGEVRAPRLVRPVERVEPKPWRGPVLITGGTGTLGAHTARHLVRAHGIRDLVLVSRQGPSAEGADELRAELTRAGASVRILAVDITDEASVRALLTEPFAAVVHTAGALADTALANLDASDLERTMRPKADAAALLDELTRGTGTALVLYSSAAGVLGNPGQGAYAAANAFLDALARRRAEAGDPALSLAWGLWSETSGLTGGADTGRMARAGVVGIATEQGLRMFDAALGSGRAVTVPVAIDRTARRPTARAVARAGPAPAHRCRPRRARPDHGGRSRSPRRAARRPGAPGGGRRARADRDRRHRGESGLPRPRVRLADLGGAAQPALGGHRREAAGDRGLRPSERDRTGHPAARGPVPAGRRRTGAGTAGGRRIRAHRGDERRGAHPAGTGRGGLTMEKDGSAMADDRLVAALRAALLEQERLKQENARLARSDRRADRRGRHGPAVARRCRDSEQFWSLLDEGRDVVTGFPTDRGWDLAALYDPDPATPGTTHTRHGGFLADAGAFDAGFFGISPREALAMDPQQRLLLETSWEALERAGIAPDSLRGSDVGVFTGLMYHDYAQGAQSREVEGFLGTGTSGSVAAGRVSYVLGVQGPAVTVDTACSSSLVSLHLAAQALRAGECSLALAGGATVLSTPAVFIEFSRQRGLSVDGRCKSFAEAADGTGWAEGVGVLALMRLSDALAEGREVLAVLRGSAVNQDGASNGLTAPNGPAQQEVIRRALASAGLRPSDVDAVEAHGTGTTWATLSRPRRCWRRTGRIARRRCGSARPSRISATPRRRPA
ncbi:hypothetical protein GCM10018954_099080 [Kutzneria kofuensis]